MRKTGIARLTLGAVLAVSLVPLIASADNEENCLATPTIVIFSGTDQGVARRGLNAGSAGCLTAGDPDLDYIDTNYITPGATHAIVGVIGGPADVPPGSGTFTLGDLVVNLEWRFENSRWESQSIPLPPVTGTVTVVVGEGQVTYEKVV